MRRGFWFVALIVLASCGRSTSGRPRAQASSGPPVRVGSILLDIEPVTMVRPTLPAEAAGHGVTGPVILEIRIAETGDVSVLSVVRGHPLLNELAKDAVSHWKYRPVVINGQVVPVIKVAAVPFRDSQGLRRP
jgi:TonB family protein